MGHGRLYGGLIEREFAETVAGGGTLFHYTTTIQNHMSYTADKYGEGYDFPAVKTSAALSDGVRTMLEVYIEGARDADAMLGRLRDYFAAQDEPVVLVYFGDHLPYLGDNMLGYAELGLEVAVREDNRQNPLCSYETPYIIWANDAAADMLDWDAAVEALELPESGRLSASFLGAAVLELTGRGGESPWFAFLNQLRRQTPVVQKKTYLLMDGTYVLERDLDQWAPESGPSGDDIRESVLRWRQWSYYKLRYKDVTE